MHAFLPQSRFGGRRLSPGLPFRSIGVGDGFGPPRHAGPIVRNRHPPNLPGFRHGAPGAESNQANALAKVQREMQSSKKFNHPFYWAPFVLVGQRGRFAAQI